MPGCRTKRQGATAPLARHTPRIARPAPRGESLSAAGRAAPPSIAQIASGQVAHADQSPGAAGLRRSSVAPSMRTSVLVRTAPDPISSRATTSPGNNTRSDTSTASVAAATAGIEAPRIELYDLNEDPGELVNVFAEEPGVGRELLRELKRIREESTAGAPVPQQADVDEETVGGVAPGGREEIG